MKYMMGSFKNAEYTKEYALLQIELVKTSSCF